MPARIWTPPRIYLGLLAALFVAAWIALAIHPWFRQDWALENTLVGVVVAALALTRPRFSLLAWTLLFIFGLLHIVGAHYTYAEVPYDTWLRSFTGHTLNGSLGLARNHYDRLVHFCFGLLLFLPFSEWLERAAGLNRFWRYFFPACTLFACSALFELFEWGAAELFGGDLGVAYLGTQGDVWDAQKDMLAALTGALIAAALTAAWRSVRKRRAGGELPA